MGGVSPQVVVGVDGMYGFDGRLFESYIIIIGGSDDGEFGACIRHTFLGTCGQHSVLFVDATQASVGIIHIVVELFVAAFTLTKAHLLDVGNKQFYLVVGDLGHLFELVGGFAILHLGDVVERKVVERLGLTVVIGLGKGQSTVGINACRVEVAVMTGVRKVVQPVYLFVVGWCAS